EGCLIGAGALVSEGKIIPPNSLVIGLPGKVMRELTAEEIAGNLKNAERYKEVGQRFLHE
ncbi:MAG: gamma carbonic anhydrase family protein, partial [Methanocorpusculum sp.]|nr:gamma carbonic anhydrase family protein [Methanocorpusculum sp.]